MLPNPFPPNVPPAAFRLFPPLPVPNPSLVPRPGRVEPFRTGEGGPVGLRLAGSRRVVLPAGGYHAVWPMYGGALWGIRRGERFGVWSVLAGRLVVPTVHQFGLPILEPIPSGEAPARRDTVSLFAWLRRQERPYEVYFDQITRQVARIRSTPGAYFLPRIWPLLVRPDGYLTWFSADPGRGTEVDAIRVAADGGVRMEACGLDEPLLHWWTQQLVWLPSATAAPEAHTLDRWAAVAARLNLPVPNDAGFPALPEGFAPCLFPADHWTAADEADSLLLSPAWCRLLEERGLRPPDRTAAS